MIGTLLGDLLSFIFGSLGPGLGVLGPLILDRSPLRLGEGDLSERDLLGMFSYSIRSATGRSVSSWTGVPTIALLLSLLGVNTSSLPGEKDLLEVLSSLSDRSFECLL